MLKMLVLCLHGRTGTVEEFGGVRWDKVRNDFWANLPMNFPRISIQKFSPTEKPNKYSHERLELIIGFLCYKMADYELFLKM